MTKANRKHYQPRKRSHGGASKSVSQEQPNRPIIRSLILLILLSLAGGVAAKLDWQGYFDKVGTMAEKPIRHVMVEGDFVYVEKSTVQQELSDLMQHSFVDVDLREIKQQLEVNPWIAQATLNRQWPDKLNVVIQEQQPIARWGDKSFINTSGTLIRNVSTDQLMHLPILMGPEDMQDAIINNYLALAQMFSINKLSLTGIYVDAKQSWRVTIDNQIELILGSRDVLTKMQNFALVYNTELKSKRENIKRIDLRYNNAMAVQWQEEKIDTAGTDGDKR